MVPAIYTLDQIKDALVNLDLVGAVEEGFVAYSNGNVIVPPVGELLFENPPGDAHIKYGYIKGAEYYVIKLASGFYDNNRNIIHELNGKTTIYRPNGLLVGVPNTSPHSRNDRL